MFRHILVPLDGSPHAAAALPYAVALARIADARICLLAVVEPAPVQESDERRVAASTAYLESVALPLRARGLAVTMLSRYGNPAAMILAETEARSCSLVVMGTHGRTGLARLRMGSVARHVLRHATVPTLVVPSVNPTLVAPSVGGNGASTGEDATITGITVPLDGSPLAETALPVAASIAAALSVPLALFRVIPSITALATGWGAGYEGYYPITEEMERDEEGAVAAYLQAVATPLREQGLAVRELWRRDLATGTDETIAANLSPTGIVVIASHGRGGVLRWVLGSTAEGVLDRAPCPILVVRAGATTGRGGGGDVPARARSVAPQAAQIAQVVGGEGVTTGEMTGKVGEAAAASTDTEVADAVADTIARHIPMPMPHIGVSVQQGIVTLRGNVTDDLESHTAENAARRTRGVRSVVNRITNMCDD